MSNEGLPIIFGGAAIRIPLHWATPKGLKELQQILRKYKVKSIDTAQNYGDSERLLGSIKAGKEFNIDTKWNGGYAAGSGTKEKIVVSGFDSLDHLKIKKVDIFYLHAPDATVPIADTLAGVNHVYKAGGFKRFGLSNFKAEDVQIVYDHCAARDYVLPSVYQGNYSAVARLGESLLLPTLRKLNMSFYAYSPIAGGFLSKTKEQVLGGMGRFNKDLEIGKTYSLMYSKPTLLNALSEWEEIAHEAGCPKAELAYRWVSYDSVLKATLGDAVVIGAMNGEQLRETLDCLERGPLSPEIAIKIDAMWETIKHEAPLDNFHAESTRATDNG